jgi:hypothetical protein
MTDVFVYYFMRPGVPGGEESLSNRRASLETIQGKGEAVMQSQQIVDHTELDANGFVIGGPSNESKSVDELWPQIRSLELRAKSRDAEALKILEGAESVRKQVLHEESLELRNQALVLKARVEATRAENLRNQDPTQESITYWAPRSQTG